MKLVPAAAHRDVVVVGAGPAGLVTATALATQGVDVLLVEARATISDLPRAVGISMRQMELFRSWGLEQRLRAGGDDVELAVLETTTAAAAANGTVLEMNAASRAQSEVVSPTSSARVPQDHLERVLMDHLETLPTATIRRGTEVSALSQDRHGVRLEVRDASAGAPEVVTADYVVAADGARSRVRAALGITATGPEDTMSGVAVEFRAPLWPVLGEHRYALYTITHPEGSGVLIPAGQGDRWQFGVVLGDGDDVSELGRHDALRRRIRTAAGAPDLPVDIVRVHAFDSGAQLAERFSDGRVYLAGDAAHRVTPRGGNGLAMAVRDGIDLGWRLAWVIRGWAPQSFLATYEHEGRPVVGDAVARAADPDSGCRAVISEMQQDLGGRIQHAWIGPGVSTLDLVGPGLTLLTTGSAAWQAAAAELGDRCRVPVAVSSLPPRAAHALGLRGPDSAVLVRPDGVPVGAWWASRDPLADLERAVAAVLGSAPSVEVRTARDSDLAAVTALISSAYAGYETEMTAEMWRAYSADLRPSLEVLATTLVAELDGEVVGSVRYYASTPNELRLPTDAALIRVLAVVPELEGRGIARLLMEACLTRAVADGRTALMLHTTPFMKRAVELYSRLGYTRAPAYDIRADEHFRLSEPTDFVAWAYSRPVLTQIPDAQIASA